MEQVIVCINRKDTRDIRIYRTLDDVPDEILDDDAVWYIAKQQVRGRL